MSITEDLDKLAMLLASDQEVTRVCDDYKTGKHAQPYSPDMYEEEFRELVERSITNLIRLPPLIISQVCKVEGYRRAEEYDSLGQVVKSNRFPDEFKDFRRLRLMTLQTTVHEASAAYGQAFVEVTDNDGEPGLNVLSSLNTTALFDNPVSDATPRSVLQLIRHEDKNKDIRGRAFGWDAEAKYELTTDNGKWVVAEVFPHDFGYTPIVRFPCFLDTEGRVSGLIFNLIPIQDRINQSVLDLLTGQAYTGNQVYTMSGVTGQPLFDDEGTPVVDADGNQIHRPVQVSSRRVLASDDPDTKFGTLNAAPLDGLLAAINSALEVFAVAAQQSPYIFHGKIANLSADALAAADSQFIRLVTTLMTQWGECWAQVFRMFADVRGDQDGATAWDSEVRWADFSIKAFSAFSDGLAKIADSLEIPKRGLWPMVPGVSSSTIEYWDEIRDDERDYQLENDPTTRFDREVSVASRPSRDYGDNW